MDDRQPQGEPGGIEPLNPQMYEAAQLRDTRERAVLVKLILPRDREMDEDPLSELESLADTAGAEVIAKVVQRRPRVNARYYIGNGKAEELADLCLRSEANLIIFDHELSPAQARNLERLTRCRVITRTELILDIFATRARTRQARLQVELAQLKYQLPRLRRMWTHLSRIGGGIGLRGPGETQLEVDRRKARERIAELESKIERLKRRKQVVTEGRRDLFTVALVGYTNVGKSSLLNALTGEEVFVEDRLFATLDATTRAWALANGQVALLTDTVGFIRNIPHDLVASFHATLEEVRQADLLLHVVDISHPAWEQQVTAVNSVLAELECREKPSLLVLNKCDRLPPGVDPDAIAAHHEPSVAVSARTRYGLEHLCTRVEHYLLGAQSRVRIRTHAGNGRLLAYIARHGSLLQQEYADNEMHLWATIQRRYAESLGSEFPDAEVTLVEPTMPIGQ